mmetsp:Transcript_4749/g.14860  ORF Transcript_4749/g.14860 Transcript_4749/m.14860 type:complete len:379 (-) Transcript_4749:1055-2191(-)
MRREPVGRQALAHDEAEAGEAAKKLFHLLFVGEVVGLLRVHVVRASCGGSDQEELALEVAVADHVTVPRGRDVEPVAFEVHLVASAADAAKSQNRRSRGEDEGESERRQQVLRVRAAEPRTSVVAVALGRLLPEAILERRVQHFLDGHPLRALLSLPFIFFFDVDDHQVLVVAGHVKMCCCLSISRMRLLVVVVRRAEVLGACSELRARVQDVKGDEDGDLKAEVGDDGDGRERAEGVNGRDPRVGAGEKRGSVRDARRSNGRSRHGHRTTHASSGEVDDERFVVVAGSLKKGDLPGVVVEVAVVVDGADDDEGVVEADAQHQKRRDRGQRRRFEREREHDAPRARDRARHHQHGLQTQAPARQQQAQRRVGFGSVVD